MKDAVAKYQAARQQIAKTYTAEKALTPGGNFNANVYARELAKGKPLTGEAKSVAEFASQFPRVAKLPERIPPDTFGFGDLALAAGKVATGNAGPLDLAKGALTLGVRPAARAMLTSKAYQSAMVNPQEAGVGLGRRSLSSLADIQSSPITSLAELSAERRQ